MEKIIPKISIGRIGSLLLIACVVSLFSFVSQANEQATIESSKSYSSESKQTKKKSFKPKLNLTKSNKPRRSALQAKPWYSKISTFASINRERRDIDIKRRSLISSLGTESFTGEANATNLALTSGGQLLKQTSFHLDLTLTDLKLDGLQHAVEDEYVRFKRHKTLTEFFVEHRLSKDWSIGGDLYYGGDYYRNIGESIRIYDEEMGGGISLERQFKFEAGDARLRYIFSHRKVNLGNNSKDDSSRHFHSILGTFNHQWSFDMSSDINVRWSYYPSVDEFKYWEAKYVWSIGHEFNYRLSNSSEFAFNLDYLAFDDSSTSTVSLNYRYRFGASESKRRMRRHKIPRLLIK